MFPFLRLFQQWFREIKIRISNKYYKQQKTPIELEKYLSHVHMFMTREENKKGQGY